MNKKLSIAMLLAASSVFAAPVFAVGTAGAFGAVQADRSSTTCANLPTFAQLQTALKASVQTSAGGSLTGGSTAQGFGFPMWATLVDASGRVCAVAKIGGTDPWLGSRVISAQKANTANAFSTNQVSLSTANLFTAVQPGGSLYGLQHSNPVNTIVAYRGAATAFGTATDPMVGLRVGGVNVFGGGLALYNSSNQVIGAIGVSGDTSCNDHNIAWVLRQQLAALGGLVANKVPGGITLMGSVHTDNIQYGQADGWDHATCAVASTQPAIGGLTN
jgi:uncharacterized protein GlcG (DUF336 family)